MISFTKKLSTKFHFLVNNSQIFDIFRQKTCMLCDQITDNKSGICEPCTEDLAWNKVGCQICSFPLYRQDETFYSDSLICGECLTSPPPFTMSIIPFTYSFPINKLVQNLKYGKELYWLKPLSKMFTHYLHDKYHKYPKPDLLIPVPMHKNKLKLRGYNQAELLAKEISRLTDIPSKSGLLRKTKESKDQASLNKTQRLKNLKKCFALPDSEHLEGKHIALIDDVMTTKATSEICSQLLLENGATRVDVWCLARTPKSIIC